MNAVAYNTIPCLDSKDKLSNAVEQKLIQPSELLNTLLKANGLLNNDEAAAYLGVSPGTLEVWRCTKRYNLAYIKVGRLVKYRVQVLEAFLAAQTVVV